MERKYLRPNKMRPVPLGEDFWKELVMKQVPPGLASSAESAQEAHRQDVLLASDVANEVNTTIRNNRKIIETEVLKEIAPTAVNIMGNQYDNLISLSFDQDEILRIEEDKRRKMREKIINSALNK